MRSGNRAGASWRRAELSRTVTRFTPASHSRSNSIGLALRSSRCRRSIRRPAVGGLYLNPPSSRRIVRRRDHDAVGQARLAPAVVSQNRVRNRRRGRVFVAFGRSSSRRRSPPALPARSQSAGSDSACVSMPRNSGPSMLFPLPVKTNRLADGQDVPFVEGFVKGRPAMSRGAERNPLLRNRWVWDFVGIRCDQPGYVHQHRCFSRLSCIGT